MTELLSWISILVGLGLMLAGLGGVPRPGSWPGWAMAYLVVFRRVVVGACLVGVGIGLVQGWTWLVAVGVCVGIGEFLESSYYMGVLRWGQRRGTVQLS
jgi:hypothetical protein